MFVVVSWVTKPKFARQNLHQIVWCKLDRIQYLLINYLKNSDQICESKAQNSTESNGDSSIYSKVKPKNINNKKKKSLSFENVDVNYIERDDFNKLKPMSSCENILTQIDNDIKKFVECNKKKYEMTNMDDAFTSSV